MHDLNLKCKKIGLFGLGISNLGAFDYLSKRGACDFVIRSDQKIEKRDIPRGLLTAKLMCGDNALADINEDILLLSPSIKRDRAELKSAKKRGVILTSDCEMFLNTARGMIFAVTGSDGKSTTCEIAYKLLKGSGADAVKSGNCGASMLGALEYDGENTRHIIELSSFMLEYIKPKVYRSLITSVSENHLDWHKSYDAYIKAKANILERASERAVWYDEDVSGSLGKSTGAEILISARHKAHELKSLCYSAVTLEGDTICIDGKPVLSLSDIKRSEPHNIRNFMSAIALTNGFFDKERLLETARAFDGIEHRCRSLGVYGGVEYIDSSVDSTPRRTAVTLNGLNKTTVVILGGRGKGLSYEPLLAPLKKYASCTVVCGENRDEIIKVLTEGDYGMPIYTADSFCKAVRLAGRLAEGGCKRVLLSPASTSYNEFKSFEERAKFFKKIILE